MIGQLPLEFKLLDSTNFASFFAESNKQIVYDLKNFVINKNYKELFLYLWGKPQVGKTHLLQAVCNYSLENKIQAMYLPLKYILSLQKYDCFVGLENVEVLCLDDIHVVSKSKELEEKFFYLFNNLRANQHKLIVAANVTPSALDLQLPDLKSRMGWGITYAIKELNESEKIIALIMRAAQIGLDLDYKVASFLLHRISRNSKELFSTLAILDNASLAAKRRLTIPFVKAVLKL